VPTNAVNDIKSGVELLLSDSDCAGFINKLLNTAADIKNSSSRPNTDILGQFNTVLSQGGLVWGVPGESNPGGNLEGQNAQIALSSNFQFGRQFVENQYEAALSAIHETIHLVGSARAGQTGSAYWYGDVTLARAVDKMQGLKESPARSVLEASTYWSRALKDACTKPKNWK